MCDFINCFAADESYAAIIAALIGLIGGIAAVGGAIWVAGRQSKILENQIKAQTAADDRAHAMERVRFRSDLFDRRLAVYRSAKDWLYFVSDRYVHGIEPTDADAWHQRYRELTRDFSEAEAMADFLFEVEVPILLRKLFRNGTRLIRSTVRLNDLRNRDALTARQEAKIEELDNGVEALVMEVGGMAGDLLNTFKPYMTLTQDQTGIIGQTTKSGDANDTVISRNA